MAADQQTEPERYLTTTALGKMFSVSSWTVRQWLMFGVDIEGRSQPYKFSSTKINGRFRVPLSQARELANLMYGDKR